MFPLCLCFTLVEAVYWSDWKELGVKKEKKEKRCRVYGAHVVPLFKSRLKC